MVKFILMICLSSWAQADFLGFGSEEGLKSRIPTLTKKLDALDMEKEANFEESFNLIVKEIENALEEEKLLCAGETADPQGKVVTKEQRQLCFRDLKSHYIAATDKVFTFKKKYLGRIHAQHIEQLTEIQSKLKADIEKSF